MTTDLRITYTCGEAEYTNSVSKQDHDALLGILYSQIDDPNGPVFRLLRALGEYS